MDVMIPRAEVEQFDRIIKDALRREDPKCEIWLRYYYARPDTVVVDFAIMGSYRRGESLSSDIDVVVWHE